MGIFSPHPELVFTEFKAILLRDREVRTDKSAKNNEMSFHWIQNKMPFPIF